MAENLASGLNRHVI